MSAIQLTVRSMPDSPAIKFLVNKYYQKIQRVYPKLGLCRVVIDVLHKHKNKGKMFSVSVDLTLQGREILSKKQNQNFFVAIKEAFTAIEKILEKHHKKKVSLRDRPAHYELVQPEPETVPLTTAA